MDLVMGPASRTNNVAGCNSVVEGGTRTWSVGSGSISVMGSCVEFMSMAEDLSCLGLSGLRRLVQSGAWLLLMKYVPGSQRASFSMTPKVREDPHSHSV